MIAAIVEIAMWTVAATALSSLGSVYVVCLIVGGGLLVVSTVFGGDSHDADVGGDVDVDIHVDGDVDLDGVAEVHIGTAVDHVDQIEGATIEHAHMDAGPLALSNWFSVRFLVYFAATFGLLGTVLTYMSGATPITVLGVAVVGGLVVGQGVHQTLRALRRTSGGSEANVADFLNQTARVTIAIVPPKLGEVGVRVGNKGHFLRAAAKRSDDSFTTGERVVIVAYAGGTAEVVSREEHAFISKS